MAPPALAQALPLARIPGRSRPRRAAAVYDLEGHEVLITLACAKCRQLKPLAQFGLRRMPDGAIRNQPWCRSCRGAKPAGKGARELDALVS